MGGESAARVQRELDIHGSLVIGFLRVNPVFPTGILNYLLGLTNVRLGKYTAATAVWLLPPSVALAWVGSRSGAVMLTGTASDWWNLTIAVGGTAAVLVGVRLFTRTFAYGR
jgi:uncharacterized membrane protein YdjX (TVP38/TMEM64 family)